MTAEDGRQTSDTNLRRTEIRTLALYATGLVLFAVPIASMLTRAWDSEGVGYHVVWGIVRLIDVNIDVAVVFPLGVFLGVLVVLWFDDLKRTQAALLTVSVALVGSALLFWRWSVNVDFQAQLPVLIIGLLFGFIAAGGHRIYTEEPLREFRRTFHAIYILVSGFIIGSLIEAHTAYNSPIQRSTDGFSFASESLNLTFVSDGILLNLIGVIAFVGILRAFVQYEDKSNIFVLGPTKSGKTTLMTGLFSYAVANQSTRCNPTDGNFELRKLYTDMDTGIGFGGIDDSDEHHSFIPLSFEYSYGNIFSQYVTVKMIDYPGKMLSEVFIDDVRNAVKTRLDQSFLYKIRSANNELWPEQAMDLPPSQQSTRMAELVCDSDTLVLVIPMNDFVDDLPSETLPDYHQPSDDATGQSTAEYLAQYDEILHQHQSLGENRDVIVIVTMADLVIEHFEQTNPGSVVEEYDEFRSYVRDRVFVLDKEGSKYNQYVEDVYPFFFEMDENKIPKTDSRRIYGAGEILKRISR